MFLEQSMEVELLKNQTSATKKFTNPRAFNIQDEEMKDSESEKSMEIDLQDLIGQVSIGKDIGTEIKET